MDLQGGCETDEALAKWAVGDLLSENLEEFSLHVESCPQCQARLAEMEVQTDDFVQSLTMISLADLSKAEAEMEIASKAGTVAFVCPMPANPPKDFYQATLNPPCLLGPYEVRGLIGRGGMGEVYEAKHLRLDRSVALKVIRGYRLDDPTSHDHFLKEMSNAGKLDHPNLVRAYDAWEADNCLYLVFELLEGKSLQLLFGQEKNQTLNDVMDAMVGICAGLLHLHNLNLIHCDIKPSNVMKLSDGTIKLFDFGLATGAKPGKYPKRLGAGTKGYMAPEQEKGDGAIGPLSDIFSLGCVLKFMLKGVNAKCREESKSTELRDWESLAERMTKTDPRERPQTVAAVCAELEKRKRGKIPGWSWQKGSWVAALALLLLGTGLVFGPLLVRPFRDALGPNEKNPPGTALLPKEGNGEAKEDPLERGTPSKNSSHEKVKSEARKPFVMKMVTIPAGSFEMGASVGDDAPQENEFPTRKITFAKPFQMGTFEVTVGQFTEFVEATGYKTFAETSGSGGWKASTSSSWGTQNRDYNWSSPGYEIAPTLPVTMVTYKDANAFCAWLSKRDGQKFRLPTEAEWEYACRADTTSIFPFPIEDRDSYCWSLRNVKETVYPRPVGIRQPNPWGLYDMKGNVREWCHDWYNENAYKQSYETAPNGPPLGSLRIYRGGCFMDLDLFLRSSHRSYIPPDQVLNNQGFRVLKE